MSNISVQSCVLSQDIRSVVSLRNKHFTTLFYLAKVVTSQLEEVYQVQKEPINPPHLLKSPGFHLPYQPNTVVIRGSFFKLKGTLDLTLVV